MTEFVTKKGKEATLNEDVIEMGRMFRPHQTVSSGKWYKH